MYILEKNSNMKWRKVTTIGIWNGELKRVFYWQDYSKF